MNSSQEDFIQDLNQFDFETKTTGRPFIFIDSSDPINPNQVISHEAKPMFKPPFPPVFHSQDLIAKKQKGANCTRSPNAFILYRRAFVKAALNEGFKLPMTVISTMASHAWENELPFVKEEYKKIAQEAKIQHEILFPKVNPKKKSKRWRVYPQKPRNPVKQSPSSRSPSLSPTSTTSSSPFPWSPVSSDDEIFLEHESSNQSTNIDSNFNVENDLVMPVSEDFFNDLLFADEMCHLERNIENEIDSERIPSNDITEMSHEAFDFHEIMNLSQMIDFGHLDLNQEFDDIYQIFENTMVEPENQNFQSPINSPNINQFLNIDSIEETSIGIYNLAEENFFSSISAEQSIELNYLNQYQNFELYFEPFAPENYDNLSYEKSNIYDFQLEQHEEYF
ncbi:hypothetical protein G9A89_010647 [Geosiphon pyriformis]|nr:hypothetical protein G9A89_010647 [Geosiphon pyriformis]